MKCPQCEADVLSDSAFCHKCGASLEVDSLPAQGREADGPPREEENEKAPPANPREPIRSHHDDDPEEELWQGGYSPRAMAGPALLALIVSIGGLVLAGMFDLWIWVVWGLIALWLALALCLAYRRLNVSYRLTSQRFFHQTGILHRVTDRIEVIDMDDISYAQRPVERLLGTGTIKILSSDRSHPELTLPGIERVAHVATLVDQARRKERLRRGLHIEAV